MVSWPDRRFIDLVGCQQPLIQAPMAGASGVELCVAAISGGALGSLPCAMLTPDEVRNQVGQVRLHAKGPLNLNFFCHQMPAKIDESLWVQLLKPYYDEYDVQAVRDAAIRLPFDAAMCTVVEALKPDVVSFHFGLPETQLLDRVKATGAIIIGNATTLEEALWLQSRGVDAVVTQGVEAGGHSGRFLSSDAAEPLGLIAFVPQARDALAIPIIAAGGIADGRGIAAAFVLGASAVQLGTAYLYSPEAAISHAHRQRLREGHTIVTNLMTGGLARGLRGRLINELGPVRPEAPPYPLASLALAPIRAAAERQGEFGFGPMWAGQGAPLGESMPAADLTRKLAADALSILAR